MHQHFGFTHRRCLLFHGQDVSRLGRRRLSNLEVIEYQTGIYKNLYIYNRKSLPELCRQSLGFKLNDVLPGSIGRRHTKKKPVHEK